MKEGLRGYYRYHSQLAQIRFLACQLKISFCWLSRRGNREADSLAKRGISLVEMYRGDSVPEDFVNDSWHPR